MKKKTIIPSGYEKVSESVMLDELLKSETCNKLLTCHIGELKRIKWYMDRKNYISQTRREYLTVLYIDVILNGKTFKPEKKVNNFLPITTCNHIGMIMYNEHYQLNN